MTHPNRKELAGRLEEIAGADHEKLCEGRNYSCTCGFDQREHDALKQAAAALRQSPSVEEVARVIFNHCYEASCGDTSEMMDEWAHCEDIAQQIAALYGRGG